MIILQKNMYNDLNLFGEIFTIYLQKSYKKCNISCLGLTLISLRSLSIVIDFNSEFNSLV
jgi:hypothetical protein